MSAPDIVLVCDLDDTLIDERDYADSGMHAVASLIHELYGIDVTQQVVEASRDTSRDPFTEIIGLLGLPESARGQLLGVYRNHRPAISLRDGAQQLLDRARALDVPICIITDGRTVSQRQKLVAVGLDQTVDLVLISEEVGVTKPDPRAFSRVMSAFPGRSYVYVADNPAKDFIAPHALGWSTIGVRNPRSIHPQSGVVGAVEPQRWVTSLADLAVTLTRTRT